MSAIEPSQDLVTALQSEVMGEAAFRSACLTSLDGAKRAKLRALWRLEAQTKQRIINHYQDNGIRMPGTGWLAMKSSLLGLLFHLSPWKMLIKSFLEETDKYLVVFRRLEAEAAEADKALFQNVVDHELAIQSFAQLESQGRGDASIEAVTALLET